MINIKELKNPVYIPNYGFMFQWCCKCKALHVWHFEIVREKTEDDDYVVISYAGYPELSKLREFHEKNYKEIKRLTKENKELKARLAKKLKSENVVE